MRLDLKTWRILITAALFLLGSSRAYALEIQVYAPSSLKEVLEEIAEKYKKDSGNRVFFTFGPSNVLAQQIIDGTPRVDLFIADSEKLLRRLEEKDLIDKNTTDSLVSNSLAIVTERNSGIKLYGPEDLTQEKIKKIAMADPIQVPAGIEAKKYLKSMGVWEDITSRILPTPGVRAALDAVIYRKAEAGIVYKTDGMSTDRVKIIYEVPIHQNPLTTYWTGVTASCKQPVMAQQFQWYLDSKSGNEIFEKHGFILLE